MMNNIILLKELNKIRLDVIKDGYLRYMCLDELNSLIKKIEKDTKQEYIDKDCIIHSFLLDIVDGEEEVLRDRIDKFIKQKQKKDKDDDCSRYFSRRDKNGLIAYKLAKELGLKDAVKIIIEHMPLFGLIEIKDEDDEEIRKIIKEQKIKIYKRFWKVEGMNEEEIKKKYYEYESELLKNIERYS
jgi:hypothetical protein